VEGAETLRTSRFPWNHLTPICADIVDHPPARVIIDIGARRIGAWLGAFIYEKWK